MSDHDSVPEQLRRAWSYKDAVKLHQATGAFLWCLDQLQKIAPASQFDDMKKSLRQSFFAKFLDLDLIHMLEEKLPATADIKVFFNTALGFAST